MAEVRGLQLAVTPSDWLCITTGIMDHTLNCDVLCHVQPPTEAPSETLPEGLLLYQEPSGGEKFWTSFKLAFALPWRRFKSESVLVFKVGGLKRLC